MHEATARSRLRDIQDETDAKIRAAFRKDPQPHEVWCHHSGRTYFILAITNTSHPSEKFPPTVIYEGANGNIWSRPLSDWHRSFTCIP